MYTTHANTYGYIHTRMALQVATSANSNFTGQNHQVIFLQSDSWETQVQPDPHFSYCLYIHFNAQENIILFY